MLDCDGTFLFLGPAQILVFGVILSWPSVWQAIGWGEHSPPGSASDGFGLAAEGRGGLDGDLAQMYCL